MFEWICVVDSMRVDDSVCRGKNTRARQVVIGDDDINTLFLKTCNMNSICRTTIDGDNEGNIVAYERIHRFRIQPEPLGVPVRNVNTEILESETFKKIVEYYSARNTVRIVVSIHNNTFIVHNRACNTFHSLLHISEKKGVMEVRIVVRM